MMSDATHPATAPTTALAMPRRHAIVLMAGAGAALLAGCSSDGSAAPTTATPATTGPGVTTADTTANTTATATATTECSTPIPQETAGPFPGDGSNGPDVLSDPGSVRSDITGSFGSFTGTAAGVPVTLHLTVLDRQRGCAARKGGAVYVWHADRDGLYSMYTAGKANYLRGVGELDDTGTASFRTVFPGCYPGRWPHIHFEVYPSLADAAAASNLVITSQLALPKDACESAYQADGYAASSSNLSGVSIATDMVFSDGVDQQLATVTGDAVNGYTVELTMTV